MSESLAILSIGWGHVPNTLPPERAEQMPLPQSGGKPLCIDANPLFRRRPDGAKPLQHLLASLSARDNNDQTIYLLIDVFAYAYLSAAKNIDMVLPEASQAPDVINPQHLWRSQAQSFNERLADLERFEQAGRPPINHRDAEYYLQLRTILIRSSAREERRVLLHLLIGGPATLDQVAEDLGMSIGLAERVVRALSSGNCPATQAVDESEAQTFRIHPEALPAVTLGLHLRSGLNLLDVLADKSPPCEAHGHG